MTDFQYLFRVVLVGNAGVGKSSLLQRYVEDSFSSDYLPTIGVDFKLKMLEVDGKKIKLQVWDTSGHERFRAITNSYFRGSHGVMIVYDITNQESYDNKEFWMNFADTNTTEPLPKVLVGCKSDLSDSKQVEYKEAQAFAEKHGMECLEASGKDGQNVEETFTSLINAMLSDPKIMDNLTGGRACQSSAAPIERRRHAQSKSALCSII